jgi:nucleoid DNA-binding protein
MAKSKSMTKSASKSAKAPKAARIAASGKARKKSELFNLIAEHTELSRKQVAAVFDTLGKVMAVDLAKPGADKPRTFVVPGMMKVQSVYKPATKARQGINPFTKEPTTFKAKPARTNIKIRPLKALKAMV